MSPSTAKPRALYQPPSDYVDEEDVSTPVELGQGWSLNFGKMSLPLVD
uniref:Uncharacterized protein n=1 Tax=Anguilla anguilla TaxID=7936 RepID=A0A0E9UNF4_ANGAN